METLDNFMKNAKGLSKNPLGIIALFISLIYAFACIVLGVSLSNLNSPNERLPLIWFIIGFPIIILLAFIYLVIYHHEKLYAPGDFRNDDAFIKAMDVKDIKVKRNSELQELNEAMKTVKQNQSDDQSKYKENHRSHAKLAVPVENISLEEKIKNAETWAICEFSLKNNLEIKRNQKIFTKSYGAFELDGVSTTIDSMYAIEVKYWSKNIISNSLKLKLQEILRRFSLLASALSNKNIVPVILVVLDVVDENIKIEYDNFISQINQKARFEIYEYSDLKSKYKED